jgi:hypothetical protein
MRTLGGVAPGRRRRLPFTLLSFVRWWLPALVCLGGLIALAFNPTVQGLEGAAHIWGAGLAILLLNLLVRVGFTGDKERDEEDAAREYFDAHGYWPDEAPQGAAAPPVAEPGHGASSSAHRAGPVTSHPHRPRPRGER